MFCNNHLYGPRTHTLVYGNWVKATFFAVDSQDFLQKKKIMAFAAHLFPVRCWSLTKSRSSTHHAAWLCRCRFRARTCDDECVCVCVIEWALLMRANFRHVLWLQTGWLGKKEELLLSKGSLECLIIRRFVLLKNRELGVVRLKKYN